MSKTTRSTKIPDLAPQEYEVLKHLWDGLQQKEIAAIMTLSTKTVKNYTHALYGKLHVSTNVQAVRRGMELGILRITKNEEWP